MKNNASAKSKAKAKAKSTRRYWSAKVTETSDAMTLEPSVFKKSANAIARSVRASAERSHRRKTSPFQSAMSMLSFYENRGGTNLSATQHRKIKQAKAALRRLYGKPTKGAPTHGRQS